MRDLAAPVLAAAVCSNGVPAHGLCSDEGNCWPQQVSMESEPGPYSMSLMDMRFGPSHECCPFEFDMVARHPHKRGPALKQGCIGSQHVHRLPQGQPPSPRPLSMGSPSGNTRGRNCGILAKFHCLGILTAFPWQGWQQDRKCCH